MNKFKDTINNEGFGKCVSINKKGKKLVINYLNKFSNPVQPITDSVFDKVEFKVEEQDKYGNLFLPTWYNKTKGIKGWYNNTKKEVLLYMFVKERKLFVMSVEKLRKVTKKKKFPEKAQYKYDRYKKTNVTYGLCVPIKYLEKNGGLFINI